VLWIYAGRESESDQGATNREPRAAVEQGEAITSAPIGSHVSAGEADGQSSGSTTSKSSVVLKVDSIPQGAEIRIDGQSPSKHQDRVSRSDHRLVTPALIESLTPGTHEIVLFLPGYSSWEKTIEAKAGQVLSVSARLELTRGVVYVDSTPPNAQAHMDSGPLCVTPCKFDKLRRDLEHELVVEKEGYRSYRKKLTLDSEELTIKAELAPAPSKKRSRRRRHGTLALNSIPWAKIYVDGRDLKRTTPALNIKLSPGIHVVRLQNPDHGYSATFKVRIRPGRTVRKSIDFRKN